MVPCEKSAQEGWGKLELDAISMLSAKVYAMAQRLEWLNINFISSSTHSPSCEICVSVDHFDCEWSSQESIFPRC